MQFNKKFVCTVLVVMIDFEWTFKRASKNNDSISRLYIAYQMLVILFSLVGPAIIFTMLVFAQVPFLIIIQALELF